jgi:two-component system response regulator MprA
MPDKWEYPWYAAWDLAFHCVAFAPIDPDFAKEQLILLLREWYMHPNGQIPAYEDEPQIAHFLRRGLTYKGFEVLIAPSGEQALEAMQAFAPDLVVLDILLPDMDGYEVCRRLRASHDTALQILILTAKDDLSDKVVGLDSGADDYMTKPFVFEELLARIRAALRRVEARTRQAREIRVGDLTIDTAARQVWRAGTSIELTVREFDLLELLAQHAGQVLPKGLIFERIWGYDNEAGLEVIKVYINYLRAKLNEGGKSDMISTVRGVGYMLKAPSGPLNT